MQIDVNSMHRSEIETISQEKQTLDIMRPGTERNPDRDFFNIDVCDREPMQILVVSWYAPTMRSYIAELASRGYEITVVGSGVPAIWKIHCNDETHVIQGINIRNSAGIKKVVHSSLGKNEVTVRLWHLSTLLELAGNSYDFILHFQDWTIFVDREKSPIPYYYYWTEAFDPEFPRCAHRVLVPNDTMKVMAEAKYRPWKVSVLPHVLREEMYRTPLPPDYVRKVPCSFAGKIHNFDELYEERRDIVFEVERLLGEDFEGHWAPAKGYSNSDPFFGKRGNGYLSFEEYRALLTRSRYVLNVPTRFGINLRDLEVPAAGATLITKKTIDHVKLGFKDGVNCYFYDDPEEVVEIVRGDYDPELAYRGYLLVHSEHTAHSRVDSLLQMYEDDFDRRVL